MTVMVELPPVPVARTFTRICRRSLFRSTGHTRMRCAVTLAPMLMVREYCAIVGV